MKSHPAILAALSSLAFFFVIPASAQNGPVEKRYAGSFRDSACTVTLQWLTTDGNVVVSGSLTTQSGAALQVSGAETSPGLLELTVETDESINHKLSLADAGGKAIWAGTYITFVETARPAAGPTGAAMPPAGVGPAPGLPALPPLGGGLPPLPPLPGTGTTVGTTMPPAPGGLTPGVPKGSVPVATSGPAEEIRLAPTVWPVGKWPEGMAHDGNHLWVAESGQRTLAQVNTSSGAIITRVNSGRLPVGMAVNPQTGEVFAEVATDQTLIKYSRAAKGGKFASLPDYPNGITADDVAVWVLMWVNGANDQGRVIRYDQRSGASTNSELLGDAVSEIGKAGNQLWVTQAKLKTTHLNLLNPQTAQRLRTITLNGFAPGLAVTENSVFVAGGEWDVSGEVVRVDPFTMQETSRKQLPGEFIYQMTANNEYVVAAGVRGTLWILNAGNLTLVRTIHLDFGQYQPASLLIDGDTLYITTHKGSGEEGSILVVQGWAPTAGHP